jgi:hypothetical protein
MEFLDNFYVYLDALLIAPYRISEVPIIGFYVGTFVLCMWCIIVGEITFRTAARANRNHLNKIRSNAVKMHNLSIKAIALKDKESYQSCNSQANDAFSKYFFNMITQGAALLWPVPFALAWMGTRFSGVTFELPFPLPIVGDTLGFAVVPVNMYILCRIIWGKVKPHISFLSTGPKVGLEEGEEEMISWEELGKKQGIPDRFWNNEDAEEKEEKAVQGEKPAEQDQIAEPGVTKQQIA